MRAIETNYEDMSIERDHWNSRSKPSHDSNTAADAVCSDGEEPGDSEHPDRPEDSRDEEENQGPGHLDRNQEMGTDGDKLDGGDNVPSEPDDGTDEDSDHDEQANFEGDLDEIGSDAGYESYGLADP